MPDPNNIALREHGIVFMLIPKVANTSVKMALADALGIDRGYIHNPNRFEYVDTEEAKDFPQRIAFVRDPLDRLLSCYRDKVIGSPSARIVNGLRAFGIQPNMPFLDFVETVAAIPDEKCGGVAQHFRSQAYSLCYDDDSLIPNVLVRFEELNKGWAAVQQLVQMLSDLQLPPLERHQVAAAPRPIYCGRARGFALQRYCDDVRLFGYAPSRKYVIDPDKDALGRSICNVHREAYKLVRDHIQDTEVAERLQDLLAEAFDMGKRMNKRLRELKSSQYDT